MNQKVNEVFYKELKSNYEYNFGSSTALLLHIVEEYSVKTNKGIVLLSRNEPLELLYDICKKEPAISTHIVHGLDEDNIFTKNVKILRGTRLCRLSILIALALSPVPEEALIQKETAFL
ncbi:MAG: hypothetical protein LBG15_12515 [Dysgonamonadaceae bacterium]|jgi:hypothetical protein|nr:hypothetical protein [Dysgonamonadaceae bacterium]